MKTDSWIRGYQSFSLRLTIGILGFLVLAATAFNLHADGCFVAQKFVWDKQKDINEPTQKAIIAYDSGHEELILQVKYDGPLDEFGWLIPVPNLPTVKKGSMECFYELSKFTQKRERAGLESMTMGMSSGAYGKAAEEPPVTVVEVKTVGAYNIAVLSTKDSGALQSWLKTNDFTFHTEATDVIDSYVKRGWYFIAVKINLEHGSLDTKAEKLASGELNPLQITFASERCVFPLKISSLNHTPSEVQVYVLSPEPLVEKASFEKDQAANYQYRTNMIARRAESVERMRKMRAEMAARVGGMSPRLEPTYPEPDNQLASRSEIDSSKLVQYATVGRKDIPVCSRGIALLGKGKEWWLMKRTWTFQPEEMRDLEFDPAVPVFTAALADNEGAFAAASLLQLGTNGCPALIAAIQNTNPVIRAHAMSMAENMVTVSRGNHSRSEDEEPDTHRGMDPELVKLITTLLNDPDPEIRLHAVYAAENSQSPLIYDRMLGLLRDDYEEISQGAQWYLREQRDETPKHIPLFLQMLKDTNADIQISGLRILMSIPNVKIPREDLLSLFSGPRLELAGMAVAYLRGSAGPGAEGISPEEARPLLLNSNTMVRLLGLATIMRNELDTVTVELLIPLLRDPEAAIRARVYNYLTDLTGQTFPADQPDQWEKWWEQNKATFKVNITTEELRQKQIDRARQWRSLNTNSLPYRKVLPQ